MQQKSGMIAHGEAPFLECSTRGDKRFSAFCAYVDGRSIEDHYQGAKVFADGTTGLGWREAKGRRAVNAADIAAFYTGLWHCYLTEHPELVGVLKAASGLSDIFGQPGSVCQATVLWQLRDEMV